MDIIRLKPIFKHMIWGGSKLHDIFGYDVDGEDVGECWGISAHPNGDCVVADGEYKGVTLSRLFEQHRELFGNYTGESFPLLTKIIDARKDLSIQVHPDDRYAYEHENGSLGKTECWYVLDADPGTTIVIGHNAKDHQQVEEMILQKRWSEFIREIPVHKGDFFQITPGTVHAIKGGTLILETQQNSDITYRVYDYDRLSDGKPRQLHVKQSIDVIKAPYEEEKTTGKRINDHMEQLIECPFYTVWRYTLQGNGSLPMKHRFYLVSVINGAGTVNGADIKKGDHFIIPSGSETIQFGGELEMIISTPA